MNEYLVITSYDPIWYLFHSMVSYHQAIWTDCNDYDLIKPTELDSHPEAYSTFCDSDKCGDMSLDGVMYFGGYLSDHRWALINKQDLTVRKSYHFDRWNIIYDLGNGDFFKDSGLSDYCKGKLNPEWWILEGDDDEFQSKNKVDEVDEQSQDKIMNNMDSATMLISNIVKDNQLIVSVAFVAAIFVLLVFLKCKGNNRKKYDKAYVAVNRFRYGSV